MNIEIHLGVWYNVFILSALGSECRGLNPKVDQMTNPTIIPSSHQVSSSNLSAVLLDNRAIVALIDQLLARAGLSQAEACRRLGITPSSFNQYRLGRRCKPSMWWIVRLAEVCGAKVFVEFPSKPL